ncbi:MAG: hypothetical protein MR301_08450 [Prevotella sp.]|nr:hypothetical protein [Prevotella sp.]MDD7045608.1 hypothetical protein [Prevotella sp.]MDY5546918.1 hypothetical protein [Prevotella sp.]
MKRHILTFMLMLTTLTLAAQDKRLQRLPGTNMITTQPRPITSYERTDGFLAAPLHHGERIETSPNDIPAEATAADTTTLHLPALDDSGRVQPMGRWPMSWWGGYSNWDLHPGLNVNVGASVTTTFGKGGLSGAGFAQHISMMYAVPLTERLSLAVGGYFNNMDWGRMSCRQAGINAVLGYRFDDHWEGYIYAQKSIVGQSKRVPYPLMDLGGMGDRIGAAVRYNFSPSFSIQVNVEGCRQPAYQGFHTWDDLPSGNRKRP